MGVPATDLILLYLSNRVTQLVGIQMANKQKAEAVLDRYAKITTWIERQVEEEERGDEWKRDID